MEAFTIVRGAPMRDCKPCRAVRERLRRQADGDRVRALERAKYARTGSRYKPEQYAKNRAKVDAASARWATENRERRRAISRASRRRRRAALDPIVRRALDQRSNQAALARRRSAEMRTVSPRDLARLAHRQRGLCVYCEQARPLTLEHVIPIARGGRHAIGNLALACTPCNSSKRDRLLIEWATNPRGRR